MEIEEAVSILKEHRVSLLSGVNKPIEYVVIANAISSLLHDRLEFKSCKEPVVHRINISDMTCLDCGKDLLTNQKQ